MFISNQWSVLALSAGICSSSAVAAPVAYWSFDEASGQDIANAVPSSSDLTLQPGTSSSGFADPAWTSEGFLGAALDYTAGDNSTGGSITTLQSTADIEDLMSQTFTVEAFVNLDSLPASGFSASSPYNIVELRDVGGGFESNYSLRVRQSDADTILEFRYTWSGDNVSVTQTVDFEAGTWYYVAASRDDADTITLYSGNAESDLGGTLAKTVSIDSVDVDLSSYSAAQLAIGAELKSGTGFQRSFDGLIDEVRISDTALSEGELLFNTIPEPGSLTAVSIGIGLLLTRRVIPRRDKSSCKPFCAP